MGWWREKGLQEIRKYMEQGDKYGVIPGSDLDGAYKSINRFGSGKGSKQTTQYFANLEADLLKQAKMDAALPDHGADIHG